MLCDNAINDKVQFTTPLPPVAYDMHDVRYLGKWTCRPEQVVRPGATAIDSVGGDGWRVLVSR